MKYCIFSVLRYFVEHSKHHLPHYTEREIDMRRKWIVQRCSWDCRAWSTTWLSYLCLMSSAGLFFFFFLLWRWLPTWFPVMSFDHAEVLFEPSHPCRSGKSSPGWYNCGLIIYQLPHLWLLWLILLNCSIFIACLMLKAGN